LGIGVPRLVALGGVTPKNFARHAGPAGWAAAKGATLHKDGGISRSWNDQPQFFW
jgi:hypothetical protein